MPPAPRCHGLGIELEPEWAHCHPKTQVGDATFLPFRANHFDVIATSPTWGNRLSDHHDAKDNSVRHSYTHDLGRKLSCRNTGTMTFTNRRERSLPYRGLHRMAWTEAARVLRPGGLFLLDIGNFYANREEQLVTEWHLGVLLELGFTMEDRTEVPAPRLRFGQNRERLPEYLLQLRGPQMTTRRSTPKRGERLKRNRSLPNGQEGLQG